MRILILIISVVGITAISLAVAYLVVDKRIAAHQQKIQDIDAQLATFGDLADRVQTLFARKNNLEERLDAVLVLDKDRGRSLVALRNIARTIPPEVWLIELREKPGVLFLKGFGMSIEDISRFADDLEIDAGFDKAQIQSLATDQSAGLEVYAFEINATQENLF